MRHSLAPDVVARLAELREGKGWSYKRIAEAMGKSEGWVSWYCLVHAIEKPGTPARSTVKPGSVERRGDHLIRRFSEDEDARLLELEAQGLNYSRIARSVGRHRNSVLGRLATLARREARAEG